MKTARGKEPDAWQAAKQGGCDRVRLERLLKMTPAERVAIHRRALTLYESLKGSLVQPAGKLKRLRELQEDVRRRIDPDRARASQSFFKTGPGEYGAGDVFIGLTVPQIRRLAKQYRPLSLPETKQLLRSPVHEERLLALLILVGKFAIADAAGRQLLYETYLRNTRFINNWDLVDSSAEHIVGAFLRSCSGASVKRRLMGQKKLALRRSAATTLLKLAQSKSLWERRIAILATFHFIT